MKKLFCAILMLLLCASCFAGTLYIKTVSNVTVYENVRMEPVRSSQIMVVFIGQGRKISVATNSEWWYIE